ncbi:MAG: sensor histidine kinase [Clostridia bacterium]|nr:sensor histidine kinase [Clostridia bacterium]
MKDLFDKNFPSKLVLANYKIILFGLLVLVEIFLAASNWSNVYFANIPAWYAILPVTIFLTAENAVKLWALKKFSEKLAFYIMDVAALLVLTIFTNGVLISILYMIILSDFYLCQEKLRDNLIMGASCIVTFLITFALSNSLKGIEVDAIALVSNMLSDILLISLHFVILHFSIRLYRKNQEIEGTLEELNESNSKLQAAYAELHEITALEERQRIAKDIHDTAGHSITTVIMQTEAAKLIIDEDPSEAKRKLTAANLQAKRALEELRESVHVLSGMVGGHTLKESLLEIIHDSSDGTGVKIRYDIDDIELCDAKRRFILNSLKEGISNGLRHGNATAFWFELKAEEGKVHFLLSDNGEGQQIAALKEGFGLSGMHARAESLGGEVWFETEPGEGFEIHLVLPADGNME